MVTLQTAWPSLRQQVSSPLRKLKQTQPTKTHAVWLAHLEEEATDDEEGADSKDPDGLGGMTKEFMVYLARAVKDA